MTDLTDLIERVRSGSGEDRVLEAEIACAMRGYTMHEDSDPANGTFAFWSGVPWESECSNCSSWPALTTSLDAVVRLVEEKLPGWQIQVTIGKIRSLGALEKPGWRYSSSHKNDVRAILLCLLLALQAQEGK